MTFGQAPRPPKPLPQYVTGFDLSNGKPDISRTHLVEITPQGRRVVATVQDKTPPLQPADRSGLVALAFVLGWATGVLCGAIFFQ